MKVGFITIAGKPNAGKSTLLNAMVGEKVAIVSWRPQTTRNKITGIVNGDDYQLVFTDTPGLHNSRNKLGDYMMKSVSTALEGVDAILYVVNGDKGFDDFDKKFWMSTLTAKRPSWSRSTKPTSSRKKRFSSSWKACSNTTKSKPSCQCPQRRARTSTK